MRTPWGELVVADAHVHFFSSNFFRLLAAQKPGLTQGDPAAEICTRLEWEPPPADPVELGARWVAELDRNSVDQAAIIASLPGDEESVTAAAASAPDRLIAYAMVNPTAVGSVDRIRRLVETGLLRGLCFFPAMHRYSIQDDRLAPFLEIAESRPGVIVFVHCGVLTVGIRKRLGLPSLFDMRFSNPIDLHAVALAHPKIPFVVPHFGAGYFREALMLCDLCPNVYLDTSSTNSWLRYEGLDLAAAFRRAGAVAGFHRLLFGTDSSFFPRGWHAQVFQQQVEVLKAIGADEAAAAGIFGGNLRRLFSEQSQ
jgi:predicted TIM-barrel fold metal-dependent hydrolase